MWIKILNLFLVIIWRKIYHFQVFSLASKDSKTDLQFCPSEISKRHS